MTWCVFRFVEVVVVVSAVVVAVVVEVMVSRGATVFEIVNSM